MPIKLLIVDDSILFRTRITTSLSGEDILIVGCASDAIEATDFINRLNPDVVVLDVELPKVNGITFLKNFIPHKFVPTIVVSATKLHKLTALEAGAVDFVRKPEAGSDDNYDKFITDLIRKIKIAATFGEKKNQMLMGFSKRKQSMVAKQLSPSKYVIAIGASTGGTEAIFKIIKQLPEKFPGVVVVQHMPEHFTKLYAERLQNNCEMLVKEAEDGDRIEDGKVIIAAGNYHLSVNKDATGYYITSKKGPKVSGHCPSVDVMFDSVAKTVGSNALGVILTGMGADGAKGITNMREKGAYTIGQDKDSCVVYGMPNQAFKMGGICRQLPIEEIASDVIYYITKKKNFNINS